MSGDNLIGVTSPRPRPMVQNGNRSYFLKTGEAGWGRDVHHILNPDGPPPPRRGAKTLCGIDCSEWLTIGPLETLDHHCCARCRRKVDPQEAQP